MKKVFIVHGFQASPNGHWFPWLKQQVESLGLSCDVLNLTDSLYPQYAVWKANLADQLQMLDEQSIIIAHSLGCLSVLDYLSNILKDKKINAFIGVSGFSEKLHAVPELDVFIQGTVLKDHLLRMNIQQRHVIFSNNDAYVPAPMTIHLGQLLNAQMLEIKGAGHFLGSDGYFEFPQLWERLKFLLASE